VLNIFSFLENRHFNSNGKATTKIGHFFEIDEEPKAKLTVHWRFNRKLL